jgi:polysaccharide pyruvyl transferase WcaK-like protein
MLEIALIFHSAKSDNLGVGALTVSEIDILRRLAAEIGTPLHITLVDSKGGRRAPYVGGPDITVTEIRSRNVPAFLALARRADIVIDIGAGDSFADIYGPARLRRLFALKFLTHLAGRPLVVAPQTVGPFTRPLSRRLARRTLRASAIVASRDRLSAEAARALGAERVIEASDVALRLPYDPPGPRRPGPPRVGLNVSGLLMNGGYTRRNMFGLTLDYPALMRDIIRAFLAHPDGCEVHLVPHVITPRGWIEDDVTVCLALAEALPGPIVAPEFATPSEAKSYIAGLDFFAGARMHACIAAFSAGVPVVPMAYSRKFEGLFGTLGYRRTVDCTAETQGAILAKVIAGYDDRATLAAETRAALALGQQKLGLYEAALGALMRERLAEKARRDAA